VYTITLEKVGMEQNITFAQGELIDKVLMSKSPSAMCDLTDGFVVLREYEDVVFRQNSTKIDINASKQNKDSVSSKRNYKFLSLTPCEFEEYKKNAKVTFGAFQGVDPNELCIRTRKPGDVINTGNGTKKIQDFFVDQKVPKHCREDIKLLAKGSKILWVLPSENFPAENMRKKGRFSADFRAQKDTEDMVIVLEILCTL
jgi:tRNA(Ile)-lysidine synthetase-like protein